MEIQCFICFVNIRGYFWTRLHTMQLFKLFTYPHHCFERKPKNKRKVVSGTIYAFRKRKNSQENQEKKLNLF